MGSFIKIWIKSEILIPYPDTMNLIDHSEFFKKISTSKSESSLSMTHWIKHEFYSASKKEFQRFKLWSSEKYAAYLNDLIIKCFSAKISIKICQNSQ